MKLTQEQVIKDIAAALDLNLTNDTTLVDVRLRILEAVDRLASENECLQKELGQALRHGKRFRAQAKSARRIDLQSILLSA